VHYFSDTKERLAFVAKAIGWDDPNDLTKAERDQINTMAKEEDRNIQLYPVVHAWRTSYHGGSQLTFWCRYCKDHHVHGRHTGPGRYVDPNDNVVVLQPDKQKITGMEKLWRNYVRRFEQCTYNSNVAGGRGVCTCPIGSGDGHRVAHCSDPFPYRETDVSPYRAHGYILHEVEPNDARALVKPKRTRRS
jgi:hypothetical protein